MRETFRRVGVLGVLLAACAALLQAATIHVFDDVRINGGLVVGFTAVPAADQVQVGDANHVLDFNSGNPRWIVDTGSDYYRYQRASNTFDWVIAGTQEMLLGPTGLQITDRLGVGVGVPTSYVAHLQFSGASINGLLIDDTVAGGVPNLLEIKKNSARKLRLTNVGLEVPDGLIVGFEGTPVADEVQVGDTNFKMDFDGTNGLLVFDSGADQLQYTRSLNRYQFLIAGTTVVAIDSTTVELGTQKLQMVEQADPAAPPVNTAFLYARDNGAGKTQLVIRFNTGAIQVIATEP